MSQRYYTHLSYEERVIIQNRHQNGEDYKDIAQAIGRCKETVWRELRRNGTLPDSKTSRVNKPRTDARHCKGTDRATWIKLAKERYEKRRKAFLVHSKIRYNAHTAAIRTKTRTKIQILVLERPENEELLSFIIAALDSGWTPEEISGRIRLEGIYRDISDTAIYKFIKRHPELGLKDYLPHKGRRYRYKAAKAYNTTNRNKHHIADRPVEVDDLSRFGDIEGDTIVGKDKTDRILTHVERKSLLISMGLIIGFDANKVVEQTITDILRVFGVMMLQTITYDNGVEFTFWKLLEHKLAELDARLKENPIIFFTNPYHSWERGRNENMNGRVRRFIPKGTDFKKLTPDDILRIESMLNNTPRKCLGWLTPNEYYTQHTLKC